MIILILSSCRSKPDAETTIKVTETGIPTVSTDAVSETEEQKFPKAFLNTAKTFKTASSTVDYTYEYDGNGRLMKETYKSVHSFSAISYECTYTYNTDNTVSSHKELTGNDKVTTVTDTVTTYNGKNLAVQKTVKETAGGKTTETVTTYEYDDLGRTVRYSETRNGHETVNEYEYTDDFGSYIFRISDGTSAEHIFDTNGNEIKVISKNKDGETVASTEFRYDEHNNIISEDCNGYITEYKNTYENGLLVMTEYFYDGYPGSKTTCEYDEYGNIIKYSEIDASETVVRTEEYVWSPVY